MGKRKTITKRNVKYVFKKDSFLNLFVHITPLNHKAAVCIQEGYAFYKKNGKKTILYPLYYKIDGKVAGKNITIRKIFVSKRAYNPTIIVKKIDFIDDISCYTSAKFKFIDNDIKIISDEPNPLKSTQQKNINMIFSGKDTSVSIYSLEKDFSVTIQSNKNSKITGSSLQSFHAEKGKLSFDHNKIKTNATFKNLNLKSIGSDIKGDMHFHGKNNGDENINSLEVEDIRVRGKFTATHCTIKIKNAIFFMNSIFSKVSGLLANTILSNMSIIKSNSNLKIKDQPTKEASIINAMDLENSNIHILSPKTSLNSYINLRNNSWIKTKSGTIKAGENEIRVITDLN